MDYLVEVFWHASGMSELLVWFRSEFSDLSPVVVVCCGVVASW